MNLARRLRVRGLAALAAVSLAGRAVHAADAPPAPAPAAVAEAAPAGEGCQTCSGDPAGRKPFFQSVPFGHGELKSKLHTHTLNTPTLCPGACFGYFQTK